MYYNSLTIILCKIQSYLECRMHALHLLSKREKSSYSSDSTMRRGIDLYGGWRLNLSAPIMEISPLKSATGLLRKQSRTLVLTVKTELTGVRLGLRKE
jgi:hypothetical protein